MCTLLAGAPRSSRTTGHDREAGILRLRSRRKDFALSSGKPRPLRPSLDGVTGPDFCGVRYTWFVSCGNRETASGYLHSARRCMQVLSEEEILSTHWAWAVENYAPQLSRS
jgi:hypothetical protein